MNHFQALVERHQSEVFSLTCRLLQDREQGEMAARRAFAKAYFAGVGRDPACSPLPLVCVIAIRECYAVLRNGTAEVPAQARYLHGLLARMPEDLRLLLILVDLQGHATGELAEMTGLTPEAVKSKLCRARMSLVEAAVEQRQNALS